MTKEKEIPGHVPSYLACSLHYEYAKPNALIYHRSRYLSCHMRCCMGPFWGVSALLCLACFQLRNACSPILPTLTTFVSRRGRGGALLQLYTIPPCLTAVKLHHPKSWLNVLFFCLDTKQHTHSRGLPATDYLRSSLGAAPSSDGAPPPSAHSSNGR